MGTTTASTPPLTRRAYAALAALAAAADDGDGDTFAFTIGGTSRFLLVDAGLIVMNTALGGALNAELTDAGRVALAAGPPADNSYSLNFKVGAAERACRDLLALTDLPLQARTAVEHLALALGVDDPHEDGARTGGEGA